MIYLSPATKTNTLFDVLSFIWLIFEALWQIGVVVDVDDLLDALMCLVADFSALVALYDVLARVHALEEARIEVIELLWTKKMISTR